MLKATKKAVIIALLMILMAITSVFAVTTYIANADGAVNEDEISSKLTPIRDSEYGAAVDFTIVGNTVYKNFENGCVTATLGADNVIMNTRDYGGVNYNKTTGEMEFLKVGDDYKLKDLILSRPVESGVDKLWEKLSDKFENDMVHERIPYDKDHALNKIYEKYAKMCDAGFNCGIATSELSIWDDAVIKVDFYDGDSEYGFDSTNRVHVTTIAYSFLMDDAYVITGQIFNFYKDAKAGSLSEPISDTFDYTEDGVKGKAQAFALGYIFIPEGAGNYVVKAGKRWNSETQKFEILSLTYDELTLTPINDAALEASPLYKDYKLEDYEENGKKVKGVKTLFFEKYESLIRSGFNPGIPDHEGIYYWDNRLLKQAYVGSDGTGNAWGRTNMMLILNPVDGKVYAVYGEILNIVDKESHGLGKAAKLGFPVCDPTPTELNGLKYVYQDFYIPSERESEPGKDSTIYCIEGTQQLTRHIEGIKFETLVKQNKVEKPNNPMYFYVLEPVFIVLICCTPVIVAGAAVTVYFSMKKMKKRKAAAAAAGETVETDEPAEKAENKGDE